MNYRHAYHAGNHADVLKHIILCRVLSYMVQKDKPFSALDAHAGIGRYDLNSIEAGKTGEWLEGIGKLLREPLEQPLADLLKPYIDIIADLNASNELADYPGSPEILSRMMRAGDRILLNELHPVDAKTLATRYQRDRRVTVTHLDATIATKAAIPFKERRGVVLLDPAFEVKDELKRVEQTLKQIFQRMASTVVMVWYPIKTIEDSDVMCQLMRNINQPETLVAELMVRAPFAEGGLAGSAMAIFNPPYTLAAEMKIILPALAKRLGVGEWGRGTLYELPHTPVV